MSQETPALLLPFAFRKAVRREVELAALCIVDRFSTWLMETSPFHNIEPLYAMKTRQLNGNHAPDQRLPMNA